jgi:hypothetical protein
MQQQTIVHKACFLKFLKFTILKITAQYSYAALTCTYRELHSSTGPNSQTEGKEYFDLKDKKWQQTGGGGGST